MRPIGQRANTNKHPSDFEALLTTNIHITQLEINQIVSYTNQTLKMCEVSLTKKSSSHYAEDEMSWNLNEIRWIINKVLSIKQGAEF